MLSDFVCCNVLSNIEGKEEIIETNPYTKNDSPSKEGEKTGKKTLLLVIKHIYTLNHYS